MSADLDAIRASRAACADIPWSCPCVSGEQLDAMLDELERHRAALRASPPDLLPLSECLTMRDEAVQAERAAVVAFLREQDASIDFRPRVWPMAEMIERGEHRREEEK